MNGIFIFDKPKGITSHDVVYILRRKTGIKKIGHTGTLDPMAEGVLPMCIGRATKVAEYISGNSKEYIAEMEFGYTTDTYDAEGEITDESSKIPTREEIENVIPKFTGNIVQVPPMYSALKHNGKKLYELARAGKTIERKGRNITIRELEILEFISERKIRIRINCSTGTYIRSLVYDIGRELGTYATMTSLQRTSVGSYTIEDAVTEEELKAMSMEDFWSKVLSVDTALSNMEKFYIPDWFRDRMVNGVAFRVQSEIEIKEFRLYCDGEFLGIGESKKNEDGSIVVKMKKNFAINK